MERYRNLSGSSGVTAFAIADKAISVQFADDGIYDYTYASAGRVHVERMKVLAREGQGLSTYISRNVHNAYASKR